jgi:outer membrane protein assembly factor BamE (lipoprotein component of BamABCDE complex)
MKRIFTVVIMTILLLISGCLYIPYHAHIHRVPDEKTLASIKEDVTSKEDILMTLGEPDRVRNDERIFLYWWQEEHGFVGWYGGKGGPVRDTYSLHIEFDENNIVEKYEIKKKGVFSWSQTLPDEFYEEE